RSWCAAARVRSIGQIPPKTLRPGRVWFGEISRECSPGERLGRESSYVRPLGHTASMTLTTRMLAPETWDDFAALVEANNGVWGGGWGIGFHPEGVGHGPEGNRELKRNHVTRGTVHQVLVYDGERCVGWCQFGPPAEVATIKNSKAYEKGLGELPDWRIGCIFTNSKDRGKGVAAAAVATALEEIKRAGGGVVEAHPEQTQD